MTSAVVIPWWDSGSEARRQNFRVVRQFYSRAGIPVAVGSGTRPGQAKNNGARVARAEVLLFSDADILPEHDVEVAIEVARLTGQLVYAYDRLVRLGRSETKAVWRGATPPFKDGQPEAGLMAIRFDSFEKIDGFPDVRMNEREDMIFYIKAETLLGPVLVVRGRAAHLWHEVRSGRYDTKLSLRYQRANGNASAVRSLMRAGRGYA